MASHQQGFAKGDKATHSPWSCHTKGSYEPFAALKHLSIIFGSTRVLLQKKHNKSYTKGKRGGEWGSGGTEDGGLGVHIQINYYATNVCSRCAPSCEMKIRSGEDMHGN